MPNAKLLVLVGLGNPEPAQQWHRHNIGFMAIDTMAQHYQASAFRSKHGGLLSKLIIDDKPISLFKPQTYVNNSGKAVGQLARFHRLPPEQFVVFHDELDLPFRHTRIKQGGSHAGHNGLKSIMQHLGDAFWRVRLGIGHPGDRTLVTPHVLGNFSHAQRSDLATWLGALAEALPYFLAGDRAQMLAQLYKQLS